MSRYLNPNPSHVDFLNLVRLNVGFRAHFTPIGDDEGVDAIPRTSAKRAEHAVANAIARLERIARDTTVTEDVRHEHAGIVLKAVQKEVREAADTIRRFGEREAAEAQKRAFAVLAADTGKASVYSEIRQIFREKAASGDPNWPAEASRLVAANLDVAAAINAAPGFNSGLSDERHMALRLEALNAHAPEDAAAIMHNADIAKQADRMEAGLRQLQGAWYSPANADRATTSRVDPHAALVPPVDA